MAEAATLAEQARALYAPTSNSVRLRRSIKALPGALSQTFFTAVENWRRKSDEDFRCV
jgi:hypothetical protein